VRIVLHVEPWRSSFDTAQEQMLDRVEADGAEGSRRLEFTGEQGNTSQ
jgi:hypothetical protein